MLAFFDSLYIYVRYGIIIAASFIIITLYSHNIRYCSAADYTGEVIYVRNEKELRGELVSTISKHKKNVTISYPGINKSFHTYKDNDYIDFFNKLSIDNGYCAGIISAYCITFEDMEKDMVTFQFNYLTTLKQERYINRKVRRLANKYKGKSRFEKVKGAHDYLIKHMSYDSGYYNPYYAFRKGRGTCMSYALAYQRILNEMKVPCVYVSGDNHAWNMVRLRGRWYSVDVTWDDSLDTYRYFLRGIYDFPEHDLSGIDRIKRLNKAEYSYFSE